jgi:hypothetical protein
MMSVVYTTEGTDNRILESLLSIQITGDPNEAEWFISRTDTPDFKSSMNAFSECGKITDFALIGSDSVELPSNCYIVAVEQYSEGTNLIRGKKVA